MQKKDNYFAVVSFPKHEIKQKKCLTCYHSLSSNHLLSTHMVNLWLLDRLYMLVCWDSAL